ncbi:hypothetical protein [uncultured Limosilactobacillus sp.]|nr:hypothetical protein [uncultured Limosilactobacillus sp.]
MAKRDQLDYLHYYSRRNFHYSWLSNQEVVERLLAFPQTWKLLTNTIKT